MIDTHRGFEWGFELYDKATGQLIDSEHVLNMIPNQAWDFLIPAALGDIAAIGTFYCGLYTADYSPDAGVKASDLPGLVEFTGYPGSTRPLYERSYSSAGVLSNVLNKAVITPTQDARAYGMFLVSASEKGSGSGILLSIGRFATAKQLTSGVEAKLIATASFANKD